MEAEVGGKRKGGRLGDLLTDREGEGTSSQTASPPRDTLFSCATNSDYADEKNEGYAITKYSAGGFILLSPFRLLVE